MKFKVGDRVRCLKAVDGKMAVAGAIGKVVAIDGVFIGVEFGKDIGGHPLYDEDMGIQRAKDGHGWWCGADSLRKFNMQMSNK